MKNTTIKNDGQWIEITYDNNIFRLRKTDVTAASLKEEWCTVGVNLLGFPKSILAFRVRIYSRDLKLELPFLTDQEQATKIARSIEYALSDRA